MFFALIRMKIVAILLGPAGIGLFALFSSIADVAVALAGMGVQQSGVRQIAQAQGSGDHAKIAGTVRTLARISLILGLAGGVGLAVLAVPAALLTFGSTEYSLAVAALGAVVLLRILTGGQTALLQGLRRIGDLTKFNIIAAIASVVVTVPMVFAWGAAAIVPSLIIVALVTWLTAQWYARRVPTPTSVPSASVRGEAGDMLRLGFAFMVSGFLTMGTAYIIRIIVLHDGGIVAAGLYQAAWAVAGLYVGVVLQAMGTDFYPRLTAVATDNEEVCRLVNEQTHVSLLIAAPGVIATITFAPLVISAFYSSEFSGAVELLRWFCLGMMLRVISWPMGFIIVAKGWQKTFIAIEVAAAILQVGVSAIFVPLIGMDGAGTGFVCLYVWHGLLVYVIVHRSCGFRFSHGNLVLLRLFGPACVLVFTGSRLLPFWWATAIGCTICCIAGTLTLKTLHHLYRAH
nr:O-antigen translocase [Devosia naphthalenivorans]